MATQKGGVSRREFIKMAAATGIAAKLGVSLGRADTESRGDIPYRTLGWTGEKVSMLGIGGFHLGLAAEEQESIQIVRTAVDQGINFMDNCWDYNNGDSELRMGKALRDGYRDKVFLMTKIDGRNKQTAEAQINESLRRLQTDCVDLMQFHEIIRLNDPERIFAPGGALEAMVEAQKAGKLRYIGFTGHKSPKIHLKMLELAATNHFQFATVQMPLNAMDEHYESFEKLVLPELVSRNIGVLGMKPMGSGEFLKSNTITPVEYLHYAMNLPTSVVITGCDSMQILQQALNAVHGFQPMNPSQVAALLAKTAPVAGAGRYELYKTADEFDSTAKSPQWLG